MKIVIILLMGWLFSFHGQSALAQQAENSAPVAPTCSFEAVDYKHAGVTVMFKWSGLPAGEAGVVLVTDPDPYGGGPKDYIVWGTDGRFSILVPYSTPDVVVKAQAYLDSNHITPPECRYQAPLPPTL